MLTKEFNWFFSTFGEVLRRGDKQAFQTLMLMAMSHLFGIYTPKEFADYVGVSAQSLYSELKSISLYSLQKLMTGFMVKQAAARLKPILDKSPAAVSRAGIAISGDDTVIERIGKMIRCTFRWYSGRAWQTVCGCDLLGLALTIGGEALPLHLMFCSWQGRGNTSKPELSVKMLAELKELFDKEGIDIAVFPQTLDSWFASESLRRKLAAIGFKNVIIAGKSHYVFTIKGKKDKASGWKTRLELRPGERAADVPSCRVKAESPTFGKIALLFFRKKSTRVYYLMDLSETPGRGAEIWRAWRQHHAVERFWKMLKSIFLLKSIQLRGDGLYAGLLIKVQAFLTVLRLKSQKGFEKLSVLQILRKIRREESLENIINEHFHDLFPCAP